jgi:hypothetical protein
MMISDVTGMIIVHLAPILVAKLTVNLSATAAEAWHSLPSCAFDKYREETPPGNKIPARDGELPAARWGCSPALNYLAVNEFA